MEVRFTKLTGRRYEIAITRERGPALAPRHGPGYDDDLPHDVVHLLVESEARLAGGVWGRVAAGRNTIFWPADARERNRQHRREARRTPTPEERADMSRSEVLAGSSVAAWRRGATPASALEARIVRRLAEFAPRWRALPEGGGITLAWHGGRRSSRRGPGVGGGAARS